jgi:hypothetical protein
MISHMAAWSFEGKSDMPAVVERFVEICINKNK